MDAGSSTSEQRLLGSEHLSPRFAAPPEVPADGYTAALIDDEDDFLRDAWQILKHRRWVVLATVLLVFIPVVFITLRMKPMFRAEGRLAINREVPISLGLKDSEAVATEEDWDYNVVLETQVRILQSDAVALQVIKNLQLASRPELAGPTTAAAASSSGPLNSLRPDSAKESALLNHFHNSLKINVVPRTRIVEIQFSSPDPKLAAQVVNALQSAYIEQNFKTKFDSVMQTSEWLSRQLADLQLKVEASQERLVRYQKEHGILGLDEKQNIVTSKLDQLNKDLTTAESDRIQKESLYKLASTGDAEMVAKADPGNLIEKLRGQESDLKTQYAQLTTQFGPSFPKVQEIHNQLQQVQSSILTEGRRVALRMKNDYLAAQQRENMLRAALESQKREANQLNESAIEYNLLKRDADSNRQLYEGLLQKLKEAGVSAGLKSNNIRIVDVARVPTIPISPNIPRNLALGLLLGIVGGVGLAFVVESLDNTVRTPEQAQGLTALPSLAAIPLELQPSGPTRSTGLKRLAQRRAASANYERPLGLMAYSQPNSSVAECFRSLRTSILLSSLSAAPKVILVTSAQPKDGKTTTSVNVAVVLAQRGARVLLVDADLRRPNVHNILDLHNEAGLSSWLAGADEREAVTSTAIPGLFALCGGPTPPYPAELLHSDRMRESIMRWRSTYDHIVIDTPPVLTVTDAVLLSVLADSVMVVIRAGRTTKAGLRRTQELLTRVNARVIGIVVNGVTMPRADYYQDYYYRDASQTPESPVNGRGHHGLAS